MAPPVEYTFWGYWWAIAMRIPGLYYNAFRITGTVVLSIIFLISLFNRKIAGYINSKWTGISPWWIAIPVGFILVYGIMWAIYERDREVFGAYKVAQHQIPIAAPEDYLIGKDGSVNIIGQDKYGLDVKREDKEIIAEDKKYIFPKYKLRFKKSPSRIEVTTQEGAVPKVQQIDANEYEVQFYSAEGGWGGNMILECNFKVIVY